MKKIIFSAALLMAAATFSFAGNPKGETNDAKTEAKSEVKTQETLTTYFVTGGDANNYTISTTQTKSCGSGQVACEFTSPDPALPSTISRATVDQQQNDIVVLQWRSAL